MTTTSASDRHEVLADGYCETCGTVPCRRPASSPPRTGPGLGQQLDRIELKLNRLLRHAGITPEDDAP